MRSHAAVPVTVGEAVATIEIASAVIVVEVNTVAATLTATGVAKVVAGFVISVVEASASNKSAFSDGIGTVSVRIVPVLVEDIVVDVGIVAVPAVVVAAVESRATLNDPVVDPAIAEASVELRSSRRDERLRCALSVIAASSDESGAIVVAGDEAHSDDRLD